MKESVDNLSECIGTEEYAENQGNAHAPTQGEDHVVMLSILVEQNKEEREREFCVQDCIRQALRCGQKARAI